jgi:hypothetical protein
MEASWTTVAFIYHVLSLSFRDDTRSESDRLTGFKSHERRYSVLGNLDSIQVAIYPYDNDSGPFSRGGDSGALIAGSLAEFIALLASGTWTD